VGSVTRPVKELKGFKKVSIKKSEIREITFTITSSMLEFIGTDMNYTLEAGKFNIYTGPNSANLKETGFRLITE
jgi:beta-glucosidase